MNEEFASEALCEDCPMRKFAGVDCTGLVNQFRMDPEEPSDRNLVAALPAGKVLLSSLEWPRPGHCEAIRGALPRLRKTTARRVSATACAEMYLISESYRRQVPESDF